MDYVILLVIVFVAMSNAHSCKRCDRRSCEIITNCPGNRVYDVCKCCQVCAKVANETCGGQFGIHGKCDTGLKCIIQPDHGDLITGHETGICKNGDSVTASETCQETEFYGCNADNGECTCSSVRACSNPHQFSNKLDCSLHVMMIEERKRDCTNEKCEKIRFTPKCPEDSELIESVWPANECCPLPGRCECRPNKCKQQLCRPGYDRVVVKRANGKPGQCCDRYQCKPRENVCDAVTCASPARDVTCPSDSVKLTDRMSKDGCCELPPKCECKSRDCHVTKCANGYRSMVVVRGNGRPGTCCDVIECVEDTKGACRTMNGTQHRDGDHWVLDACRECDCRKGTTHCRKKVCPQLPDCDNMWTPPGKCCPRCKVTIVVPPITKKPVRWCTYGKENYPPGATWKPEPCKYCVCEEDGYKCRMEACQRSCENPRIVEGDCCGTCDEPTFMTIPMSCPSMDGCRLTGTECPFGFKSDELGCRLCQCREKSEVCQSMDSCNLECQHGFAVNEIGCDRCKCAGKTKACKDMSLCKKECPFGYRKDRNGCSRCRCRRCMDVIANCDKKCKYGREMNGYGCEICKCQSSLTSDRGNTELMRSRTCHDDNTKHDDGEGWTTSSGRQCVCRGGDILCDMIECPVPHCNHPVMMGGFLCAVCPGSLPTTGDHRTCGTRVEGESWAADACTSCVCNAGRVMCTFEECPPAPCANPTYEEGHCCPTCVEEPTEPTDAPDMCNDEDGKLRVQDSTWRKDACTSCRCEQGGVIRCFGDKCPQVHNCLNPVIKRGQCCPQCLDDDNLNKCNIGNRAYMHGEVWAMSTDTCTSCSCVHGNVLCHREICRPLSLECKNVIRRSGECCDVCEEFLVGISDSVTSEENEEGNNDMLPIIIGASVAGFALLIAGVVAIILLIKISRRKTKYSRGKEVSVTSPK